MTANNIDSMLQPLRVTAGWKIDYNIFTEFEPAPSTMQYFFGEMLFTAHCPSNCVAIELRFEPEGDPDGEFVLEYSEVIGDIKQKTQRQRLLEEVRSRSKAEIVTAIERIIASPR